MIRNVDDFTLFTYSFRFVLFRCEFLLIRNHSGPSGSLQIWSIDYINYCKSLQLRSIFTAIVRYFPSSILHKLQRNTTKIILYNSYKIQFPKTIDRYDIILKICGIAPLSFNKRFCGFLPIHNLDKNYQQVLLVFPIQPFWCYQRH